MATQTITLKNAQEFIKNMQRDWELKHKYLILGKIDLPFQNVAKNINDKFSFDMMKGARTRAATALRNIESSTDSDGIKAKRTGEAKLLFIETAIRALDKIKLTGDAKQITSGLSSMAAELDDAVKSYTDGTAQEGADAARDARFSSRATAMMEKIKSMIASQKPRLRVVNVLYSAPSVAALKELTSVKTLLDMTI